MNNKRKPTIYKSKRKRKAGFSSGSSVGAVVPTIVTIAAAGAICYAGYSIAKPIVNNGDLPAANMSEDENSTADGTSAPEESTTTTTTETTSVVVVGGTTTVVTTTDAADKNDDDEEKEEATGGYTGGSGVDIFEGGSGTGTGSSSGSGTGSGSSSGTGSGSSSGNGTGSSSGTGTGSSSSGNGTGSSSSGTGSGSSSLPPLETGVYKKVQCSVRLPENAVSSASALREYLGNVKSKYPDAGAVVIPMKLSGGELNFKSTAAGNAGYLVNKGSMTAEEIADIIREEGFAAYASCSMLVDHLYPQVNHSASYQIEVNGVQTGDIYLDYFPDKGGKPWLDPGSNATVSYLSALVKELSDGGFSAVLCSDFTFPAFWASDEKYLNPDTFAKLPAPMIELANALYKAAPDTTDIVLDLSAYNTMNGLEPVYDTQKLDVDYVLLNTSSYDASYASSWAQSNSGDLSVSLSYTNGSGTGHHVVTY